MFSLTKKCSLSLVFAVIMNLEHTVLYRKYQESYCIYPPPEKVAGDMVIVPVCPSVLPSIPNFCLHHNLKAI